MARILDFFLDRKTNSACGNYPSHAALFAGLDREETAAIQCLSARISGSVFKIGQRHRLLEEDIEELICDCITLCLQKIRTGKYVFQGYDPATYAIEIAKNKALNFRRSAMKYDTEDLTNFNDQPDEPDFVGLSETEMLEKLLSQLDESCQNLIRLKYLEERRDKDIIEEKITQYTTVDALKNNRARCMKKPVEIASLI
jgi:DNA-directed RNA polymerase specialized sigma24 family protein